MSEPRHLTELQLHTAALQSEVKKRSDSLMNFFLAAYFLGGLWLAKYYDTWSVAIGVGGLSLLAYYSAKIALPKSNLYQYVLGAVLAVFMAQYIYQMHGLFEMHFIAFIGSAILITYQNWKLQIPMAGLVVLHHAVFGYLQNIGDNIYFTQLDYFELRTFIIHVVLAAVIFFVCGLWGYQLKKYSMKQVRQALEMGRLQKEALIAANERLQQEEKMKAQQALTESNNRFIYAAQATSDAIWDRNYSEDVIFWGDGFQKLFGYEINSNTVSIQFWASKIHPEDQKRVIETIQNAKADPSVNTWNCEYRFLKGDNEYAFVKEKAVILRDGNGNPARSIGALQDITETKRNEIILKELNEDLEKEKYFLDSIMNNLPDSIYFKDRESRIIRVSKYMADKFGVNMGSLIGKTDFDIHDDVHAKEAYQDEQEIIATGKPKIDYVEKEQQNDGSVRWISSTKMPLINEKGEIVGLFGISKNVTAIKKLEEERHSALLDKAVAQGKFEIASDVMHDIGNAVVGFGSYLTRVRRLQDQEKPGNLQDLATFFEKQKPAMIEAIGETKADAVVKMLQGLSETQRSNQEEVNRAIMEQLNIITHIQEILNIQRQYINGHESQERKPVNLRNIVNDSVSMLFASLDKTGIAVTLNVPSDLPIIKGDRTKLMQVLLNLLKNSIEAIDKNAEEKNISVNALANSDNLVIQIKDNGKGFERSTAGQLFKRGFTTKSSGTGLGLYNCRSIIESHEATIDISSEGEGKGTLATLRFKVERKSA